MIISSNFKLLGWNASYSAPFISIEKASPQLKAVLHTSYPGASPSYITESLTTKTLWRIYVNCILGPSYSKFRYKGGHYGIRPDTPHPLDKGQNCGFWSTRILPHSPLSSILRPSVTGVTSHILFRTYTVILTKQTRHFLNFLRVLEWSGWSRWSRWSRWSGWSA